MVRAIKFSELTSQMKKAFVTITKKKREVVEVEKQTHRNP